MYRELTLGEKSRLRHLWMKDDENLDDYRGYFSKLVNNGVSRDEIMDYLSRVDRYGHLAKE